jgi:hypothetical protein
VEKREAVAVCPEFIEDLRGKQCNSEEDAEYRELRGELVFATFQGEKNNQELHLKIRSGPQLSKTSFTYS